jgi:hypothetical protein
VSGLFQLSALYSTDARPPLCLIIHSILFVIRNKNGLSSKLALEGHLVPQPFQRLTIFGGKSKANR